MQKRQTSSMLYKRTERKRLRYLPLIVSSLRFIILPFLILSISSEMTIFADILFLVAIGSDLADGFIARRMGFTSQFGARFDATVDFLFVGGMFAYFTVIGIYPVWVLLLIVFMFAQFTLTSRTTKVMYDPIGKYYGSLMFGAIGLTLLFSQSQAREVIAYCVLAVTAASITSRYFWLVKKQRSHE